jgi:hypothetical protein
MELAFSNEFKKYFLLTFTKELIVHSTRLDITKLQRIIASKEKHENNPQLFKKNIYPEEIEKLRNISPPQAFKPAIKQFNNPSFIIPESKLPPHLEYLKPVPVADVEIDLFKLNPLIKDSAVKLITGSQDDKVTVTGLMGTRQTAIILSKEDIDRIINAFSEKSKIPVREGIYKVTVGNLILSAVISKVVGTRFVIKKMVYYLPPKPLQGKV